MPAQNNNSNPSAPNQNDSAQGKPTTQTNQTTPTANTMPNLPTQNQSTPITPSTAAPNPGPANPTTIEEPKKSVFHNPKLIKLFIVLAFFVVALGLFFLFFRLPVTINLNTATTLILDGQNKGESNKFKIWLRPGGHTMRLESRGFEPKTQTINQPWFKIQNLNLVLKKAPDLTLIDNGIEPLAIKQNDSDFLLYFSLQKNAFIKYNFKTKEKLQITPSIFKNFVKLKWNPSGNGVIVWIKYNPDIFANTLLENNNLQKDDIATFYYDFHHYEITEQSAILWGNDICEIAWAQNTDSFYFIGGADNIGYLGKAQNNGQAKSLLLTNIPFTQADLAIDSQENNAYILGNNILYRVDLIDPARTLEPLTDGNNTHFVLVDDENLLLGSNQADPRYKSEEKYALFNLDTKQLKNKNYYTNFSWINQLAMNDVIILQAMTNLISSQNSWLINNYVFPTEESKFEYEYLTNKIPNKIIYNAKNKNLIMEIDKKLYLLPIIN